MSTVPGFQPRWQAFLQQWKGEETPWYLAMSELAHFVVEEYEQGNVAAFRDLLPAVESTLQIPDKELQNLIWVGLFESIQNIASHHSFEADVFRTWLGPQSLVAWDEVIAECKRWPHGLPGKDRDGGSFGVGIENSITNPRCRGLRAQRLKR